MVTLPGISLLGKRSCPDGTLGFTGLDKYSLVCPNFKLSVLLPHVKFAPCLEYRRGPWSNTRLIFCVSSDMEPKKSAKILVQST